MIIEQIHILRRCGSALRSSYTICRPAELPLIVPDPRYFSSVSGVKLIRQFCGGSPVFTVISPFTTLPSIITLTLNLSPKQRFTFSSPMTKDRFPQLSMISSPRWISEVSSDKMTYDDLPSERVIWCDCLYRLFLLYGFNHDPHSVPGIIAIQKFNLSLCKLLLNDIALGSLCRICDLAIPDHFCDRPLIVI